MNRTIPPEIGSWSLEHDPYGFAACTDWVTNLPNVEDILQLSCPEARLTLDVGCYPETLTIILVLDQNWDEPIERIEVTNPADLNRELRKLLVDHTPKAMGDLDPTAFLLGHLDDDWDVDEDTSAVALWKSPLGTFARRLRGQSHDTHAAILLATCTAERALPCWELYCDSHVPRDAVVAAKAHIKGGQSIETLAAFPSPARPSFRGTPIVDCRECDTSCAALAVSHMVRLVTTGDWCELPLCLSSADMAFDQSPLGSRDHFRSWLASVAVPSALSLRYPSNEEMWLYRDYSDAEIERYREVDHDD